MRRRTFLATGWVNIVFQALFLGVLYLVGHRFPLPADAAWRTVVLLVLVGVPSTLWTAFFYLQDYQAPEPSGYVIASFVAGMAAASVFALPIERDIFETDLWLYDSVVSLVLGSTLIRGTLMSFLVYLVVRHGFYASHTFDEPIDGMVYGAFAGSGFAAITSLTYLTGHPHFTLFAIGYTTATNILIYANIGALVGYLVGRTKFFPGHTQRSHILAIVVGLLLTGLYHTANEFVLLAGLQQALWISFGLTLTLSAGILGLSTGLIRRLAAASPQHAAGASPPWGPMVWSCALVLLVLGGLVKYVVMRDVTMQSTGAGIAFQYPPARLKPTLLLDRNASLSPLLSPLFYGRGNGQGPCTIAIALSQTHVEVSAIDPLLFIGTAEPLALSIEDVTVAGKPGLRARYAYLTYEEAAAGGLPGIVWAYTDIVPTKDATYVFTFESTPESFRQQEPLYQKILASVTWTSH
jgi:RsiW-degrading membrane proteinase PrsW (M82 family)